MAAEGRPRPWPPARSAARTRKRMRCIRISFDAWGLALATNKKRTKSFYPSKRSGPNRFTLEEEEDQVF